MQFLLGVDDLLLEQLKENGPGLEEDARQGGGGGGGGGADQQRQSRDRQVFALATEHCHKKSGTFVVCKKATNFTTIINFDNFVHFDNFDHFVNVVNDLKNCNLKHF